MRRVILYIRVSTDEQKEKGYSLRDQEQKLKQYCERNNLHIVAIYSDDHSAKTFNRPEFKKLLTQSKKEHKNIDDIIFIKWDRFSRNTSQAYQMIDTFNQLNIKVNAIQQPLDFSIPEQLLMLAVYLAVPEVENYRRSLNITAGMRRAFKEGRYVVTAPKGYSNGRDQENKPILKPNDDAKYIQEAFELIATGLHTQRGVLSELRNKGFKTSKSAFARILRNPIYQGDIYIKAYKDEKEMVVKGIHEPIITESLFNKVQLVLDGGKKQHKVTHKKINDNFPLKGFILCPKCNNPLLASSSKGRSKYYSYYHCVSPCDTRYKKEDVDTWIGNFLGSISLNKQAQQLLLKLIQERFKTQTKSSSLGPKHFEKVNNIKERLISLQDLFIGGELEGKDYRQAKLRYENILSELGDKEEALKKKSDILKTYKQGFYKLENIENQYIKSDIDGKRKLVGSMFPEKFQFEKNKVRTADINPLLLKISTINKGLQGQKKRDKSKKIDLSQQVLKTGLE